MNNDVSFLLGNRLKKFDSEYIQRQKDYSVPPNISDYENSSQKWIRKNLKNNPIISNNADEDTEILNTKLDRINK